MRWVAVLGDELGDALGDALGVGGIAGAGGVGGDGGAKVTKVSSHWAFASAQLPLLKPWIGAA
jgi:hypothetical protein